MQLEFPGLQGGCRGEKDKHKGEPWYLAPERTIICMFLNLELISKMKTFCSVSRSLDSRTPYSPFFSRRFTHPHPPTPNNQAAPRQPTTAAKGLPCRGVPPCSTARPGAACAAAARAQGLETPKCTTQRINFQKSFLPSLQALN